ncbi:MAG: phosphopentomutase [Alphaproteobacteria bacterium]|nr:phosphopentomutase [Alphaproteobacteria bacterium]
MRRAFLFVMDSVGIGGAPDAAKFGDVGANTLGHIADHMKLKIPNLISLGFARALEAASGSAHGLDTAAPVKGGWGFATEVSHGKDTITGHWEMGGVPLQFEWGYFPQTIPAFPQSLLDEIIARSKLPGLLCLAHASGTQLIEDFGEEHIRTGKPIIYTSADSVIQIAAHETHFGLQRLYDVCKVTRELTYAMNIGRVIARPFVGETAKTFSRTGNRKDYAVTPPTPSLLKVLTDAGRDVVSVGKIGDIYAHVGTGREMKVSGNPALMQTTLEAMDSVKDGGFLMTNFVDFDTNFGHRRDVNGYGKEIEWFDRELPKVFAKLREGDLLIITADHGNDPTWAGTDHTRERIAILCNQPANINARESFADIGQSIASWLGAPRLTAGAAFL